MLSSCAAPGTRMDNGTFDRRRYPPMQSVSSPQPDALAAPGEQEGGPGGGASLLPRPGRSIAWILYNSLWGTWFLILAHVGAAAVFLTSPTWLDWALLPVFLLVRGYATTVGYHRYFSHRAFQ